MESNQNPEKQIDIWLTEYRACHLNRNHYENVRWIMGSIFIVTSITLLGISFWKEIINNISEVSLLAIFSLSLMSIWMLYTLYLRLFIRESLCRMREIEKELRNIGYDIKLHTSIHAHRPCGRARWITCSLFIIVFIAWLFRLSFLNILLKILSFLN